MISEKISIGLVENDLNFASTTINVLETIPDVGSVHHWESAEEFWRDAKSQELDIVFLDILLPGMNGVDLAGMLSERSPEIQKIMMSNMNSDEMIFQALRHGAIGYILKSELKDIGEVLETIRNGGAIMTPTIAFRVLNNFKTRPSRREADIPLTEKEKQILDLMVKGKTVVKVAEFLGVTRHAVQFHVKNIYKKLNVHNRAELVKKAGDQGLL